MRKFSRKKVCICFCGILFLFAIMILSYVISGMDEFANNEVYSIYKGELNESLFDENLYKYIKNSYGRLGEMNPEEKLEFYKIINKTDFSKSSVFNSDKFYKTPPNEQFYIGNTLYGIVHHMTFGYSFLSNKPYVKQWHIQITVISENKAAQ